MDDDRLQEIKARCAPRQTEVLLVNGKGDVEFGPAFVDADIDPDIPYLLAEIDAMQLACQENESSYITNYPGWIRRLQAENANLRKFLVELQYLGAQEYYDTGRVCLYCEMDATNGHMDDCQLGLILKGGEK